ncbi:MAG TPA: hypothetical protein VGH74_18230 [Planctomycetaceae bacterium]|jgi:hypothetical protein
MADGRLREQWNQTAHVMAAICNANGGEEGRAIQPDELNPYLATRRDVSKPAAPCGITNPRELIAPFDGDMTLHVVE